jgi:hypothetical protein
MQHWRMSFRVGNKGHEMWPDCLRMGRAAITYDAFLRIDLSQYKNDPPKALWNKLESAQKGSLRKIAHQIAPGDIIYAKQGGLLVGKGIVKSRYKYDSKFLLCEPNGNPWAHYVEVDWQPDFPETPIRFGAVQTTIKNLTPTEVAYYDKQSRSNASSVAAYPITDEERLLAQDKYPRATKAQLKVITPRHKMLSNEFRLWVKRHHRVGVNQESKFTDITFEIGAVRWIAELKICYASNPRHAIREALGQLLEYNHYPGRNLFNEWLIVLDKVPSELDIEYIETLKRDLLLPVRIAWKSKSRFDFHPKWEE